MSVSERFALTGMLARLRPKAALEIGTHFGGSLQALAAHCDEVHSIDIDPTVRSELAPKFPNVHFHTGPSQTLVPQVIADIAQRGRCLEFVLVDGDHTASGVRADVEAILHHTPLTTLHIVMHDSFNPDCRRGLKAVDWQSHPHVHSVELDFVVGNFHERPQGGAFARSMWGGFAHAVVKSEARTGSLSVTASAEPLQRIVYRASAHRIWHKVWRRFSRRIAG